MAALLVNCVTKWFLNSHRVIEDKWKLVVSGLEKEIDALRCDYQSLIDMVGAFLDRAPRRQQHSAPIPHNVKVVRDG